MSSFNSEKGITMVALVITFIILLILTSVGVNIGINGIGSSKDAKLNSELQMVQQAVLEQYSKYKVTKNSVYLVGTKINISEATNYANDIGATLVQIPNTYENADYYRLGADALETIGIRNATDEYVVNYVSGEVMNTTVKTLSNGSPLYTKANSF